MEIATFCVLVKDLVKGGRDGEFMELKQKLTAIKWA